MLNPQIQHGLLKIITSEVCSTICLDTLWHTKFREKLYQHFNYFVGFDTPKWYGFSISRRTIHDSEHVIVT